MPSAGSVPGAGSQRDLERLQRAGVHLQGFRSRDSPERRWLGWGYQAQQVALEQCQLAEGGEDARDAADVAQKPGEEVVDCSLR